MANLNIPFLLLQSSTCKFEPHLNSTKIISYDKYTIPKPSAPLGIPVRESFHGGGGIQSKITSDLISTQISKTCQISNLGRVNTL